MDSFGSLATVVFSKVGERLIQPPVRPTSPFEAATRMRRGGAEREEEIGWLRKGEMA